MVFNVTYRKIQDYNFQHVHESRLLPYRTRRSLHKIRGPNVLSDLCVSTGIGQPPIRTQTKIHPAPAFRAFSSSDVSKVVGRLYKNPSSIKRHSLPAVESRNCLSKERVRAQCKTYAAHRGGENSNGHSQGETERKFAGPGPKFV